MTPVRLEDLLKIHDNGTSKYLSPLDFTRRRMNLQLLLLRRQQRPKPGTVRVKLLTLATNLGLSGTKKIFFLNWAVTPISTTYNQSINKISVSH
tara:strand:+ start:58 stop:339 length:282 start_codon:yes stop_codon:yes gene_type:complete